MGTDPQCFTCSKNKKQKEGKSTAKVSVSAETELKLLLCSYPPSDGIVALGKTHARSAPSLSSPPPPPLPQSNPRNSVNICLVEHRSFSTLEGGMSAASFLHSSFLQSINAVVLWPVHVQKAKYQTDTQFHVFNMKDIPLSVRRSDFCCMK